MNEKIECADCKHFSAETYYCKRSEVTVRPRYGCYEGESRIVTNADKIRAMSDEELARFLNSCITDCKYRCPAYDACNRECVESFERWLKQEATNE